MAKTNKPYKTTKEWEFWLKDGEIYRNQVGNRGYIQIDTGLPANVRWESSKEHFDHFFTKGIYGNPPKRNMWPFAARGIKDTQSARGGIASHTQGKKGKVWKGEKYRGYQISTNESGEFFSSLDPESMYETLAEARRSVDSWLKGHHKNPKI